MTCKRTGRVIFDSRTTAHMHDGKYGTGTRRAYRCSKCGGWHLSNEPRRRIP